LTNPKQTFHHYRYLTPYFVVKIQLTHKIILHILPRRKRKFLSIQSADQAGPVVMGSEGAERDKKRQEESMTILIQQGDNEKLFFKEQDQKVIKALREKAASAADQKYRNEHKGHCFRCGTQSLAEIRHGDITIDVCINEGCGAVHLDPGELEAMQQAFTNNQNPLSKVTNAVFSVFKI
jgi:hypothetical protein